MSRSHATLFTVVLAAVVFIPRMAAAQPSAYKYDDSKIPKYTLPDPLVLQNGEPVTDADTWRTKRRPEIFELFQTQVYGRSPGRPDGMKFDVFDNDPNALGGKATRRQVRVLFTGKPDGPSMDVLLYLPKEAQRPTPVFVMLNFWGNHSINADPISPEDPVISIFIALSYDRISSWCLTIGITDVKTRQHFYVQVHAFVRSYLNIPSSAQRRSSRIFFR